MSLNVEILQKVKEHITTHPDQLRMDTWGNPAEECRTDCGTARCIAGWIVALSPKLPGWQHGAITAKHARFILGLPDTYEATARLFYAENWPSISDRTFPTAEEACRRIDEFIKENT